MEVHGAKRVIELLTQAMSSPTGAELKPGVTLMLPKQFSLVVTNTAEGTEVAFAPPADLYVKKVFGIVSLHGTLEKILLSPEEINAMIEGLPDQHFRVCS